MRAQSLSRSGLVLLALLALLLEGMSSASGQDAMQDLSQMTTAELVSKALEISKQLVPELMTQNTAWDELKNENEALQSEIDQVRSDLAQAKTSSTQAQSNYDKAQAELTQVKAELEQRANDSEASANELSEARAALKTISSLVHNSSVSWKNSTDAVEITLKTAARKQRLAEACAYTASAVSIATTIWAIVETVLRKAGK
jgi:chromosome segregation ATPase